MEAAECGAAALGIVLAYYGRHVPLEELRLACGVSRDGTKASNMVRAAEHYGLTWKAPRGLEPANLPSLPLPLIIHWNFNHFVVVEGFGRDRVYLNDPATGPRTVTAAEFDESFTGVALTLQPGPDFQPGGRRPGVLGLIRRRLAGTAAGLAYVVLAGAALVMLGLLVPAFTRVFLDSYLVAGRTDLLPGLIGGMVLIALLVGGFTAVERYYLLRLRTRLAVAGANRFVWHVLRLPVQFFTQRYAGEISARVAINDDVAALLSGDLATNLLAGLLIVFYGLLMLRYDAVLTALAVTIALFNLAALRYVTRRRGDANQRLLQEQGKLTGTAYNGLQIIETLKAGGAESGFFARWAGYLAKVLNAEQDLGLATQVLAAVPPLLTALNVTAVLVVGGLRVMDGNLTIGMLAAFQVLLFGFLSPVTQLVYLGNRMQEVDGGLKRLDDVLRHPLDPQFRARPMSADGHGGKLTGALALDSLTFGYSLLEEPLIAGFSLTLPPGARVALVGASGSGKSTIARLVAGLYQPWAGTVCFDGHPRESLPREVLANSVAFVDQEILLFEGTIRDNLTLWDPTVPESRLLQAARDAHIHEEIAARPGGYEHQIMENGRNFSGGQRQRLEIARALVNNPSVLILDEATSALDPITEQIIDQNLRRRGCACLIVAHRLSTIRDCNEIIVLDRGQVVERGTHEELLGARGHYAQLMQMEQQARPESILEGLDDIDSPSPANAEAGGAPRVDAGVAPMRDTPEPSAPAAGTPALELFLLGLTYTEGRIRALAGNQAFLMSDPRYAWLVFNGLVDVFAVPLQEGRPAGARSHLFRAEVGTALLGVDPEDSGIGLLLSGTPGTQLLQLSRARLQALGAAFDDREVVAGLVDGWVSGLAAGCMRAQPPRDARFLDAGTTCTLEAGMAAAPRRGVLWARATAAMRLPEPAPECAPTAAAFPLARSMWLTAVAPAEITLTGTAEWLEHDPDWAAMAGFHRWVLRSVAANLRADAQADQALLEQRVAVEQRTVTATLARTAALLEPGTVAPPSPPGGEGNALLAACRVLGAVQGITFRAPPGGRAPLPGAAGLAEIADASYVRTREVTLKGVWWRRDHGPLLAFRAATAEPVALLPARGGRYVAVDPDGARVPVDRTVAAALASEAFTFYRPFPARPLRPWDVLAIGLRDARADLARIVALGLLMGLLGMLTPLAVGLIFDTLIPGGDVTLLRQVGLGLVVAAAAVALLQVGRSIAVLRAEALLDATVQAAIWDRLLSLPVPFFRAYSAGDLASRAMGINTIRQVLSGTVLTTLLSSLFSAVNLALLFYYDAGLAVVACGLVLLAVVVTSLLGYVELRFQRDLVAVQGKLAGLSLQILGGVAKFRAAGAEPRAFALWGREYNTQEALSFRAAAVANGLAVFNAAFPILTAATIFAVAGLARDTGLSTGRFLAFSAAFAVLLWSALQLSSAFLDVLSVVPLYERARPILQALPEIDQARAVPGNLSGDIEISHLSFRYPGPGPRVLSDVSLRVRPGELVALVGPSGSGKSTLFRLLLGFEAPESGTIYYDGQDLGVLDVRAVRRQIGVVLQSGKLLVGSLLDNIAAGTALRLDEAWEAARLAGLEEDIRAMPMGMLTMIGESTGTLSGGQVQRLLVARALARRPRIVLFDEATSALDNRTQAVIAESLAQLQATRLVIAHRLSTVVNADRIVVFDTGRIVQIGTYQELVEQSGLFADLARRQWL